MTEANNKPPLSKIFWRFAYSELFEKIVCFDQNLLGNNRFVLELIGFWYFPQTFKSCEKGIKPCENWKNSFFCSVRTSKKPFSSN